MASTLSGPLNLDLPLPFKTGTIHSLNLSFAPLHTDIIGTLSLSPRVCRWECGLSSIMDQLPPFAAHQLKAILSEDLSVQLLKVLSLSSPLPVYVWHESAVNCCSQKVLLRERLRAELLQGSVSRLVILIKTVLDILKESSDNASCISSGGVGPSRQSFTGPCFHHAGQRDSSSNASERLSLIFILPKFSPMIDYST